MDSSSEVIPPFKMKGQLASSEQKRIITEFITKSSATELDWDALKSSVLSFSRGHINTRNMNGCVLEICRQQKRLDLAKSYMNHLKQNGQTKPNLLLELFYIRSCYASQDQLTDDDRHKIQVNCQLLFENNKHLLNSLLLEGNLLRTL